MTGNIAFEFISWRLKDSPNLGGSFIVTLAACGFVIAGSYDELMSQWTTDELVEELMSRSNPVGFRP